MDVECCVDAAGADGWPPPEGSQVLPPLEVLREVDMSRVMAPKLEAMPDATLPAAEEVLDMRPLDGKRSGWERNISLT